MNDQNETKPQSADTASEFEKEAESDQIGFFAEFWDFLCHNKKWWLTPIIAVLLLVAVLIFLTSGSAVAPFVYTLF